MGEELEGSLREELDEFNEIDRQIDEQLQQIEDNNVSIDQGEDVVSAIPVKQMKTCSGRVVKAPE